MAVTKYNNCVYIFLFLYPLLAIKSLGKNTATSYHVIRCDQPMEFSKVMIIAEFSQSIGPQPVQFFEDLLLEGSPILQ